MEFDLPEDIFQEYPAVEMLTSATVAGLPRSIQGSIIQAVNSFGKDSAKAQGLKIPVTTMSHLGLYGQRLYLCFRRVSASRMEILGGLKVGRKKLKVYHLQSNKYLDIEPLCCLDFFVAPKHQRQGIGHHIFVAAMAAENTEARNVAFDRPSLKLLQFLDRHYGLLDFTPQHNQFVVFHDYFRNKGDSHRGSTLKRHFSQGAGYSLQQPAISPPGFGSCADHTHDICKAGQFPSCRY
eukprot:jgi/Botrbrau1/7386/Bobra.0316s0029.1